MTKLAKKLSTPIGLGKKTTIETQIRKLESELAALKKNNSKSSHDDDITLKLSQFEENLNLFKALIKS